jgi:hypothetical protein
MLGRARTRVKPMGPLRKWTDRGPRGQAACPSCVDAIAAHQSGYRWSRLESRGLYSGDRRKGCGADMARVPAWLLSFLSSKC